MLWALIFIAITYLGFLFGAAWLFDRPQAQALNKKWAPYLYSLSLAVFCTAWTFYGSIGRAINSGLDFLLVYLGPTLVMLLWWPLGRKLLFIKKTQGISTLADFFAGRYGKDMRLGRLMTLLCLVGIIPYLSLQIKAISESFIFLGNLPEAKSTPILADPGFYITLIMAFFTMVFGTRYIQANKPKSGLIATIAAESIVKLLAFMLVGAAAAYTIYTQAELSLMVSQLAKLPPSYEGGEWMAILLVSGLAFLLLPRQFQMGVVENNSEENIKKSLYLFPLYLLLMNVFVLPIALGGMVLSPQANSDYFILSFTQATSGNSMAALAFLGGLSAATSMIIVSTLALGNMLSTYLFVPQLTRGYGTHLARKILYAKRFAIALILLLAYGYYHYLSPNSQLVSLGMVSFVAMAQFAPAFLGGMYWRHGSRRAASWSLAAGFGIWFYFLVFPDLLATFPALNALGTQWWSPLAVANKMGYSLLAAAAFSSLTVNTLVYWSVSYSGTKSISEQNQAALYVEAFKYRKYSEAPNIYQGSAAFPDVKSLLIKFLGNARTEKVLDRYARINNINWETEAVADSRMISFAERLLSEAIGPASAKIMIGSVVQREELSLAEVVDILQESQKVLELNKELNQRTKQLKQATLELEKMNAKLIDYGNLKDEFLYTVTHELRTPLTAIKMQSEIMHDHEEMSAKDQRQFLNNIIDDCDRLTRLISNVLDLEKFESGSQKLTLQRINLNQLITQVSQGFKARALKDEVDFKVDISVPLPYTFVDVDRIAQVLTNLLGNAFKYRQKQKGKIRLTAYVLNEAIKINITDNGHGIPKKDWALVFDKFYQVRNQTRKKPSGSGLGLAISKNIVQMHGGKIWVEANPKEPGTRVCFTLPLYAKNKKGIESISAVKNSQKLLAHEN
jgi:signal transduction histidine kinase/Na+/proline symporter